MSAAVSFLRCTLAVVVLAAPAGVAADDDLSDALQAIQAIEPQGVGNPAAAKAMQVLNEASASQIPQILKAMDGANAISLNWFRAAISRAAARSTELPIAEIETYFADTDHHPMGRLLAFDLLTAGDEDQREQMIPGFLDDPSLPLRRMAVQRLVDNAEKIAAEDPGQAVSLLSRGFQNARDVDQLQAIAGELSDLGVAVDLQSQLGFVNDWHVVGVFDNREMAGFDVVYGPEDNPAEIDLAATFQDLDGKEVGWTRIVTDDALGNVDLNDRVGKNKGAIVYAYAEFKADEARAAEFRIGTANATKIWLNGELVMSNEIYHNSNSVDKFVGDVELAEGNNQILIKVCQNEQTESWAQDWQFQFRVCDANGKAIRPRAPSSR